MTTRTRRSLSPRQKVVHKLNSELKKAFSKLDRDFKEDEKRYQEVLGYVRLFVAKIGKAITETRGQSLLTVEVGHLQEYGREYRAVMRSPDGVVIDTLLRAFLPYSGYPVRLDSFFDEGDRVCDTESVLVDTLLQIARTPSFQKRLTAYRCMLAVEGKRKTKKKATV